MTHGAAVLVVSTVSVGPELLLFALLAFSALFGRNASLHLNNDVNCVPKTKRLRG